MLVVQRNPPLNGRLYRFDHSVDVDVFRHRIRADGALGGADVGGQRRDLARQGLPRFRVRRMEQAVAELP